MSESLKRNINTVILRRVKNDEKYTDFTSISNQHNKVYIESFAKLNPPQFQPYKEDQMSNDYIIKQGERYEIETLKIHLPSSVSQKHRRLKSAVGSSTKHTNRDG